MPIDVDVLVVGGSVAGARCAEALRTSGFAGSIRVLSDDPEFPYDRPPLSKQFLAGEWSLERVRLLTPARTAELGIDVQLGRAAHALDPQAHKVMLDDGERISYGQVVLATGAIARPSPWGAPGGVHTLRNLTDSERLRAELRPGAHVVVIGGGWIGAEVAATAQSRGCTVTVVDVVADPYLRAVGEEFGARLCAIHARHGVTACFGTGVADVRRDRRGLLVDLTDGTALPADAVVVGIGAVPNTAWLARSGLDVTSGVACDEYGRALGVSDVWAAGDVARWGERRHEHWTSAVEQARAVARNITRPDDLVGSASDGYVWSDQYSWKIQLAGETGPHLACEVVALDDDRARAAAMYADAAGRLVGMATVNWPRAFVQGRRALGAVDAAAHTEALRGQIVNLPV